MKYWLLHKLSLITIWKVGFIVYQIHHPTMTTQDWRLALLSHSNGKLQNDSSSQGIMHQTASSIHQFLTAGQVLVNQEIVDLAGCLRVILQLWSKGEQCPLNPWSLICLDVANVLTLALTRPGISPELLYKSIKMVGYTLARSSLMGEVMCRESFRVSTMDIWR